MRLIALLCLLCLTSIPAQACEGFKNTMDALEHAMAQPQTFQKQSTLSTENSKTSAHIRSLNQTLDALERAIEKPESGPQNPIASKGEVRL